MNPLETRAQALDWVVRTNDPDFDDWDAFTLWLEQDAANADAYHGLLDSEAGLRPYLPEATRPEPALVTHLPEQPLRRDRARRAALWFVPAAAAALAVTVVSPRLMYQELVTRPGEMRIVSLGGRDQIVMNGGTRLRMAGWGKRDVRLESGQILVSLQEPGAAGVEVQSGDLTLVDVGTVFEVSRAEATTEVSVSEGAVIADPKGAKLRLDAGEGIEAKDGATLLRPVFADPQAVGGFTRGQLVYRNATVSRVVRDLERATGLDFSHSRAISSLRFTGTLSVAEVKRDPRSLGPLLGVTMTQSGQQWQIDEGV